MRNDRLMHSIARILRKGYVVGTGFAVSESLVATCAHVVEQAGGKPGGKVQLRFLASKHAEPTWAKVEPDFWRPADAEDVAFLRLAGALPDGVAAVELGSSEGMEGCILRGYGFPEGEQRDGLWSIAELVGRLLDQGRLQIRSQEIVPGYSGGPLLDFERGLVVGMILSIRPLDHETGRHQETAFANPAELLSSICHEIALVQRQPSRCLDDIERQIPEPEMRRGALEKLAAFVRDCVPWRKDVQPRREIPQEVQRALTLLARTRKQDLLEENYRIDLHNVDIGGAQLENCNLERLEIWGSNMHGVNLARTNLRGADLGGCDLTDASLEMADLSDAFLWCSDCCEPVRASILMRTRISGAVLRRADLRGADLREVIGLSRSQLALAITNEHTLLPSSFSG